MNICYRKKTKSVKDLKIGDVVYLFGDIPVVVLDVEKTKLERLKTYKLKLEYADGYISEVYFPIEAFFYVE